MRRYSQTIWVVGALLALAGCANNAPAPATSTVFVVTVSPPAGESQGTPTSEPPPSSQSTQPNVESDTSPQPTVTETKTVIQEPDSADRPSNFGDWLCYTSSEDLPEFEAYAASGDSVRLLQWALKTIGYYDGDIGGNYGPKTWNAAHRFQLDEGLGGTGNIGPNTWGKLQSAICGG